MDEEGEGFDVPEELHTYLAGDDGPDGPRAVAHYDREEYVFELSEDVHDNYSEAELKAIIDDFRLQDVERERQEGLYNVGSLYCSIRAFDNALLLHFIAEDGRGTIVSLLPEAAPRLTEFVDDILRILARDSGQDVEDLPQWSA